MPDSVEHDELRTLQARAYGRHGRLTDAEAARLRELEHSRGVRAVAAGASFTATVREDDARSGGGIGAEAPPERANSARERGRADAGEQSSGADPADAGAVRAAEPPAKAADARTDAPPRASAAQPPRRHRWTPAIGAAVAVAAGVGLGGLLFGDRAPSAMALTAEQQAWQNELLATAEYDAGSLRAIGEEEGVVAWYATKKDGELVCVILRDEKNTRPSCTTAAAIAVQGLHGGFRTQEGDGEREVNAQVTLDAEGDPAVILSSHVLTGEVFVFPSRSPGEEAVAAKLVEAGYASDTLWVIGHDGDVPLWSAVDPVRSSQCLIYDGSEPEPETDCEPTETLWNGGSLVIERVDERSGEITRYEQAFENGMYLTITKGIEPGDAPE